MPPAASTTTTEKKCSTCGEVKDHSEFNKCANSKDGHSSHCRMCACAHRKRYCEKYPEKISANNKQYREKNSEKLRAYNKQYYAENAEMLLSAVKTYRRKNAEKRSVRAKQRYAENSEKICAQRRQYREKNAEKLRARDRQRYAENSEKLRTRSKQHRKNNLEKVRAADRERFAIRYREDPDFRFAMTIRQNLRRLLKGREKYDGEALDRLGCTVVELREHLEARFTEGMSDETYGVMGWHIDHIKPLSKFDPSDPEQRAQACHFTNLQPLWWWDNLRKGAKWEPEEEMVVA